MILILISVVVGALSIYFIGAMVTRYFVFSPPFIAPDGKPLPGSIVEYRRIILGGFSQAVLIRGKKMDNPLLLYLHSGPGIPETGILRNMNAILEDTFTIVNWDQRGTSKSYSFFIDPQSMTIEQFIQDTHELTLYLKQKFDKKKIALMGHSWGAGLGAFVAARYPDDYSIFIGMGQPVNPHESDRLSYAVLLELAVRSRNTKAEQELRSLDGFWLYKDERYVKNMMILKKWVQYYGGQFSGRKDLSPLYKNMMCHEFTIFDWVSAILGSRFSINTLVKDAYTINLLEQVPEYQIPFFLFQGSKDINSFRGLVEEYFNRVEAPLKRIFWFENSAHWPHIEERDLFNKTMIEEVFPVIKE
jgi:pimeloyl-ACP methyl ester carboxylesterase